MTYQITVIKAIEQLIKAQKTFLLNTPGELELLLLDGFVGYEFLEPDELAEFYDKIFHHKTKGHVEILSSNDKSIVLGSYHKITVRDLEPDLKKKRSRKKKGLVLVKGKSVTE